MVTIKEIAEMLGVSTATVSNVIHGKTRKVSHYNIERIEKALKETNYVSRMDRNALHNSSPLIIGVVVHTTKNYENTFLSDTFYSHLIGVLEAEIRKAGYYMMLYASNDIEEIYHMVITWNIAGLIAITFTQVEYNKLAALVQRPVVAIDLYKKKNDNCYNIGTQDEQGGYLMTNYLKDCGYVHILVVGNRDVGVDYIRWQGYQKAMKEGNCRLKVYPIIAVSDAENKREKQLMGLVDFIQKNQATALFFLSDKLAVESLNFFSGKGITVPGDVGVTGYDDSPLSSICNPRITTINQNVSAKAKKSIEMLISLQNGDKIDEKNLLLPIRLVIRDSTENFR